MHHTHHHHQQIFANESVTICAQKGSPKRDSRRVKRSGHKMSSRHRSTTPPWRSGRNRWRSRSNPRRAAREPQMPSIDENRFQEPWARHMYNDMTMRHEAEDEAQQQASAEGQTAALLTDTPEVPANSWAYDRPCAPVSASAHATACSDSETPAAGEGAATPQQTCWAATSYATSYATASQLPTRHATHPLPLQAKAAPCQPGSFIFVVTDLCFF